jgi:hypothetical protein
MASEFRKRNSATVSSWTSLFFEQLNTYGTCFNSHGPFWKGWSIMSRRPVVITIYRRSRLIDFWSKGQKVLSGSL